MKTVITEVPGGIFAREVLGFSGQDPVCREKISPDYMKALAQAVEEVADPAAKTALTLIFNILASREAVDEATTAVLA